MLGAYKIKFLKNDFSVESLVVEMKACDVKKLLDNADCGSRGLDCEPLHIENVCIECGMLEDLNLVAGAVDMQISVLASNKGYFNAVAHYKIENAGLSFEVDEYHDLVSGIRLKNLIVEPNKETFFDGPFEFEE